ncbi:KUP/HAK/KT family potassium transporter [uncultured Enterococcus sp.]|uniref:KUP/HAK/KT family potassium transporter n=1 Tax=uncultured Enterococcus sp. TaxID=167972 RepID=UPI0025D5057E|nr:KUP/HAK/KT family potassium transporter [uncultured Enterococcus sp.]
MEKAVRNKLSFAGVLVAMGVVYGDIGTSPLYVMKAIVVENGGIASLNREFILGAVSLIFWTLTILTTIKYVWLALKADNHGEGGIFALFSLVRTSKKWLIIPAMIGGAALLADGVLTPAVTVTTAVEGLRDLPLFIDIFGQNQQVIIGITLIILLVLFSIQRFGTDFVGKAFGPIMFLWFTFLGGIGFVYFIQDVSVLRALNPIYAVRILFSEQNKLGLFILGNIFLATTGAEALYSDMGHVGKKNIHISWPYVKICLLLNYFGQAAFLLNLIDKQASVSEHFNPFFALLPTNILWIGILFATIAAIIASQALLSGSFTLVSEAIKLKLFPRLKLYYPGKNIGQVYIPVINFVLWLACSFVVIGFQTSTKMEAAYGLSITVTMLTTTILLYFYLIKSAYNRYLALSITVFFGVIELIFFISSVMKFFHGGYVAVLMALIIVGLMAIWQRGNTIVARESEEIALKPFIPQLAALREDQTIDLSQTNILFMVPNMNQDKIGKEYLYSILDKSPKRAKVYWFINVEVTDEPYTKEYEVELFDTDFIVFVKLHLGFRVDQEINLYIREIVQQLMKDGRIKQQPQQYSIRPNRIVGDFQFILIQESVATHTSLNKWDRQVMQLKLWIKKFTVAPENWFGLEYSEVKYETVPLILGQNRHVEITERKKTSE